MDTSCTVYASPAIHKLLRSKKDVYDFFKDKTVDIKNGNKNKIPERIYLYASTAGFSIHGNSRGSVQYPNVYSFSSIIPREYFVHSFFPDGGHPEMHMPATKMLAQLFSDKMRNIKSIAWWMSLDKIAYYTATPSMREWFTERISIFLESIFIGSMFDSLTSVATDVSYGGTIEERARAYHQGYALPEYEDRFVSYVSRMMDETIKPIGSPVFTITVKGN